MLCSLSLQALVCKRLEGETKYILVADQTMTCGSAAVIWLVQLSGAASFLGMRLARNLIELREHSDLCQRTCSVFSFCSCSFGDPVPAHDHGTSICPQS